MDRAFGHSGFFTVFVGDILGALRRVDLGACVCLRSHQGDFCVDLFGLGGGLFAHAVCLASASGDGECEHGVALKRDLLARQQRAHERGHLGRPFRDPLPIDC